MSEDISNYEFFYNLLDFEILLNKNNNYCKKLIPRRTYKNTNCFLVLDIGLRVDFIFFGTFPKSLEVYVTLCISKYLM